MAQIRLQKTPEIANVLAFLQSNYPVLSEAEIIKVALAEKYKREVSDLPFVDEKTEKQIANGVEDYKQGRYTLLKTEADIDKHFDSL